MRAEAGGAAVEALFEPDNGADRNGAEYAQDHYKRLMSHRLPLGTGSTSPAKRKETDKVN